MTGLLKPFNRILIDPGVAGVPEIPTYCYTTTTTSTTSDPGDAGAIQQTLIFYYQGGYYSSSELIAIYGSIPAGAVPYFYNTVSDSSSVSSGVITTQTTTCIPGSPGVQYIPPTYEDLNQNGWDAGATSVDTLLGDGHLYMLAPPGPMGIVVGLNQTNISSFYSEIDFAWYFSGSTATVMRNGVQGAQTQYSTNDYFSIARQEGKIYWLKNSTIIFSISSAISDTLFVDTSFYGRGDLISGVEVLGIDSIAIGNATVSGSVSIVADPATDVTCSCTASIYAYPSIDDQVTSGPVSVSCSVSISATEAEAWQGQASISVSSEVKASEITTHTQVIPALEGWGSDKPYARGVGYLKALTGYGESGAIIPSLVDSYTFIGPLTGAGTSKTGGLGQTDDDVSPMAYMDGLGADYEYIESITEFLPLTSWAGSLPVYDMVGYGVVPEISLVASGHANSLNAVDANVPEITLSAYTGNVAGLTFPVVTISSSGTSIYGEIYSLDAVVPEITLAASALMGAIGTVNATAKVSAVLSAYGGSYLDSIVPVISLTSSGTVGSIGYASIVFPEVTIVASATQEAFGSADLTVPQFSSLYGSLSADVPIFTINGIITTTSVSNELAYVLDLGIEEITTYTNYGFDHIVRFNGRYYGVKSDGLYLLEGSDDAGTAISASFKLNDTDFGTTKRKNVPYLYIDSDYDVDITTHVDRTQIGSYRSRLGNRRTKLARGPRGRDWAFTVSNVDGNDLNVRNIELLPQIKDRKV